MLLLNFNTLDNHMKNQLIKVKKSNRILRINSDEMDVYRKLGYTQVAVEEEPEEEEDEVVVETPKVVVEPKKTTKKAATKPKVVEPIASDFDDDYDE
jgi:hypothetical protein